ncbi:recombinase family protein [Pseudotabrizicola sediminis]|uniref:Recombinase family protein n=1 Tax=Pseudotabrizicola sediminis TaxID=2486418 RepID=A0ABY2KRE5_9RHOB|nr:recombinase family protein [Pseudotabrizicola sediminis]TGD45354.1 recombinase family protein [Pseudotabrizicola sediminis]
MTQKPMIRCAIYTRKSSDEGLEQAFNSLDAQHEACAAYIASQRHEGWKLVPDRFDDGGLSGGSLDRPALQRLLAEIDAGRIGMVVVYKIDRLTRSLVDFGRLVERLDANGCSFVSVTQAFNTASSMGRLTLNVLLSFAQFEREVTSERIRDKIAASKKKGLWMGGTLPLGYDSHPDPQRRELTVNPAEAEVVRTLFGLYGDLGNLRLVEVEAARLGLRPKSVVTPSGRVRGGSPFTRGQLHYLLTNPIYIGRIRHKDQTYPGQHPAIIDESLWETVQAKLLAAGARPRGRTATPIDPRVLTAKLRDETGDHLTPTHTRRHGRRFAYYVSHRLIAGGTDPSGWRLPAEALEACLRQITVGHLRKAAAGHALLAQPEAGGAADLVHRASALADQIEADPALIGSITSSGTLTPGRLQLQLDPAVIAAALALPVAALSDRLIRFTCPFALRRRGVETRIIAGETIPAPDSVLQRCLAEAHLWARALRAGTALTEIARETGRSEPYIRTRIPLAFLAPRVQAAILDGRQPVDLSVAQLLRDGIPMDWREQARLFGIA